MADSLDVVAKVLNVDATRIRGGGHTEHKAGDLSIALPQELTRTENEAADIGNRLIAAFTNAGIPASEVNMRLEPFGVPNPNDALHPIIRYELVVQTGDLSPASLKKLEALPPENPLRASIPVAAQKGPSDDMAVASRSPNPTQENPPAGRTPAGPTPNMKEESMTEVQNALDSLRRNPVEGNWEAVRQDMVKQLDALNKPGGLNNVEARNALRADLLQMETVLKNVPRNSPERRDPAVAKLVGWMESVSGPLEKAVAEVEKNAPPLTREQKIDNAITNLKKFEPQYNAGNQLAQEMKGATLQAIKALETLKTRPDDLRAKQQLALAERAMRKQDAKVSGIASGVSTYQDEVLQGIINDLSQGAPQRQVPGRSAAPGRARAGAGPQPGAAAADDKTAAKDAMAAIKAIEVPKEAEGLKKSALGALAVLSAKPDSVSSRKQLATVRESLEKLVAKSGGDEAIGKLFEAVNKASEALPAQQEQQKQRPQQRRRAPQRGFRSVDVKAPDGEPAPGRAESAEERRALEAERDKLQTGTGGPEGGPNAPGRGGVQRRTER